MKTYNPLGAIAVDWGQAEWKSEKKVRELLNVYDEESDHSNKAVRKTPEIESGHKVSEEVKWT